MTDDEVLERVHAFFRVRVEHGAFLEEDEAFELWAEEESLSEEEKARVWDVVQAIRPRPESIEKFIERAKRRFE